MYKISDFSAGLIGAVIFCLIRENVLKQKIGDSDCMENIYCLSNVIFLPIACKIKANKME